MLLAIYHAAISNRFRVRYNSASQLFTYNMMTNRQKVKTVILQKGDQANLLFRACNKMTKSMFIRMKKKQDNARTAETSCGSAIR